MTYKQIDQAEKAWSYQNTVAHNKRHARKASGKRWRNPANNACHRAENPYKPRIRGSRPGAERTVSAISPFRRCWCGRASRPVVPCFRLLSIIESFPEVSKG